MSKYNFKVEAVTKDCIKWIKEWFNTNSPTANAVIGISGGKDSTIVAALCVAALGANRVIGVAMPDHNQGINEADEICKYFGIKYIYAPIGSVIDAMNDTSITIDGVLCNEPWSVQSEQNVPPRIRTVKLLQIAQSNNGIMANTCNLSENYVGYATFFGDDAGSFSPLGELTVTEIYAIGDYLGIPSKWVHKVPDDGLPHSCSDEEKFGFTYYELDRYIREGIEPIGELGNIHPKSAVRLQKKDRIDSMHKSNLFKTRIIRIPSYSPQPYLLYE